MLNYQRVILISPLISTYLNLRGWVWNSNQAFMTVYDSLGQSSKPSVIPRYWIVKILNVYVLYMWPYIYTYVCVCVHKYNMCIYIFNYIHIYIYWVVCGPTIANQHCGQLVTSPRLARVASSRAWARAVRLRPRRATDSTVQKWGAAKRLLREVWGEWLTGA